MSLSFSLIDDFLDKYINSNYTTLDIQQKNIRINKLPNFLLSNNEEINVESKENILDRLNQIKSVHFFSLLEIALSIGFIQLRDIESHLDEYYEKLNYLEKVNVSFYSNSSLIVNLRNRLNGKLKHNSIKKIRRIKYFQRFLNILELIDNDVEVGMFLWILDQGTINGLDQNNLLSPNFLSRNDNYETDNSKILFGHYKYLTFLENFNELLLDIKKDSYILHLFKAYNSYWFTNRLFNYSDYLVELNKRILNYYTFFQHIIPNYEEVESKYRLYNNSIEALFSSLKD